jgi:hypothetical protein
MAEGAAEKAAPSFVISTGQHEGNKREAMVEKTYS